MSLPEPIQVAQTEAPVCSQQKETVFVLGCSSGAPRTESTVLWPFSKRDHLSPELGLATPAFTAMVRQKGTCRVDVAQQASRINHHLFPSAHIPPLLLPSSLLLTLLPPYQWQPVSGVHSLRERREGEKTRRGGEKWWEERSHLAKGKLLKELWGVRIEKLWEHPCFCASAKGQSESTLPHYHWDTVKQRREEGKLCDTVKIENWHTNAQTRSHTSFRKRHLDMLTSRVTSKRFNAMEHLSLLLLTSAALVSFSKFVFSHLAWCCWQKFGVRYTMWTSGQQLEAPQLTQNKV